MDGAEIMTPSIQTVGLHSHDGRQDTRNPTLKRAHSRGSWDVPGLTLARVPGSFLPLHGAPRQDPRGQTTGSS